MAVAVLCCLRSSILALLWHWLMAAWRRCGCVSRSAVSLHVFTQCHAAEELTLRSHNSRAQCMPGRLSCSAKTAATASALQLPAVPLAHSTVTSSYSVSERFSAVLTASDSGDAEGSISPHWSTASLMWPLYISTFALRIVTLVPGATIGICSEQAAETAQQGAAGEAELRRARRRLAAVPVRVLCVTTIPACEKDAGAGVSDERLCDAQLAAVHPRLLQHSLHARHLTRRTQRQRSACLQRALKLTCRAVQVLTLTYRLWPRLSGSRSFTFLTKDSTAERQSERTASAPPRPAAAAACLQR